MSLPDAPNNRQEAYLAAIAGQVGYLPDAPQNREEAYLDYIARNGGGGGGAAVWGGITGTLSNQTDLNTALIEKVSEAQMIAYINENVIGGAD